MKPQKKNKKIKNNHSHRLGIFMVLSLVFCGLYYIINMNCLLSDNFALEEKSRILEDLQAENERLELQKIALETYNVVDKGSIDLKMVSLGQADYLDISIAALAKN
jgi:hypothetical protein